MKPQLTLDGALDRAFSILDLVASQLKAVTAAEIAKSLDLPLPTTHRLIGNLESRGLLQRAAGTKRHVVGNALVVLAGKTIGSAFRTAVTLYLLDQDVLRELQSGGHKNVHQWIITVDDTDIRLGVATLLPGKVLPIVVEADSKVEAPRSTT